MGLQLERERSRTDHVQVFGTLRRPQEISHRQRGTVSVQKHVPIGKPRSICCIKYYMHIARQTPDGCGSTVSV